MLFVLGTVTDTWMSEPQESKLSYRNCWCFDPLLIHWFKLGPGLVAAAVCWIRLRRVTWRNRTAESLSNSRSLHRSGHLSVNELEHLLTAMNGGKPATCLVEIQTLRLRKHPQVCFKSTDSWSGQVIHAWSLKSWIDMNWEQRRKMHPSPRPQIKHLAKAPFARFGHHIADFRVRNSFTTKSTQLEGCSVPVHTQVPRDEVLRVMNQADMLGSHLRLLKSMENMENR